MLHIVSHFAAPLLVALAFYRSRWLSSVGIMVATMIVDLDHLLAVPIYDPNRCSIDFHPLHTTSAIATYAGLFVLPLVLRRSERAMRWRTAGRVVHLVGLGLLIHMGLDWSECLLQRSGSDMLAP